MVVRRWECRRTPLPACAFNTPSISSADQPSSPPPPPPPPSPLRPLYFAAQDNLPKLCTSTTYLRRQGFDVLPLRLFRASQCRLFNSIRSNQVHTAARHRHKYGCDSCLEAASRTRNNSTPRPAPYHSGNGCCWRGFATRKSSKRGCGGRSTAAASASETERLCSCPNSRYRYVIIGHGSLILPLHQPINPSINLSSSVAAALCRLDAVCIAGCCYRPC